MVAPDDGEVTRQREWNRLDAEGKRVTSLIAQAYNNKDNAAVDRLLTQKQAIHNQKSRFFRPLS